MILTFHVPSLARGQGINLCDIGCLYDRKIEKNIFKKWKVLAQ